MSSQPFTVYLTTKDSICSGVILNETTILTAGHCLFAQDDIRVYAGVVNKSNLTRPLAIAAMHLSPGYDNVRLTEDIAIIKVAKPLVFNETVHAVTPYYHPIDEVGREAFVTGWGVQLDGKLTRNVRTLRVRVYENEACERKYGGDYDESRHICAGAQEQDFCVGDSGGPLVMYMRKKPYLIGVVSYTGPQCSDSRPSVYTKLSAYRSFIERYS